MLKDAREKCQVTFKDKLIRITADFSIGTLKARKAWGDVFQALKESNCQFRLLYSAKLFFITEGETKALHIKQKLKEFMTTKPTLQKMLKEILQREEKDKCNHESKERKTLDRLVDKHMWSMEENYKKNPT
jgi:hypothetical protein